MKEFTIEQKARAYNEALERAKEKYPTCYSPTLLEYIFPELKESEGEKIRKWLIGYFNQYIIDGMPQVFGNGLNVEDVIKWLERQGEQKQDVNVQISPSEYVNDMGGDGCYLKNTTQTSTWSKKEEKVDNQNCVKSIYDVKPKFKVGDWISNDMCDVHIASIENGMYYFDEGDCLSIVFVDERYHLWTLQDAKDGDVLFHSDSASNGIFIFKEIIDKGFAKEVICYCDYDSEDGFCLGEKHTCCWTNAKILHPATKEQRDTLFAKMKEAGYIFDFKNKELKKIETEIEIPFGAKDSELQEATYYIPKGFYAEVDDDKVVIKKGEKPAAWG